MLHLSVFKTGKEVLCPNKKFVSLVKKKKQS